MNRRSFLQKLVVVPVIGPLLAKPTIAKGSSVPRFSCMDCGKNIPLPSGRCVSCAADFNAHRCLGCGQKKKECGPELGRMSGYRLYCKECTEKLVKAQCHDSYNELKKCGRDELDEETINQVLKNGFADKLKCELCDSYPATYHYGRGPNKDHVCTKCWMYGRWPCQRCGNVLHGRYLLPHKHEKDGLHFYCRECEEITLREEVERKDYEIDNPPKYLKTRSIQGKCPECGAEPKILEHPYRCTDRPLRFVQTTRDNPKDSRIVCLACKSRSEDCVRHVDIHHDDVLVQREWEFQWKNQTIIVQWSKLKPWQNYSLVDRSSDESPRYPS